MLIQHSSQQYLRKVFLVLIAVVALSISTQTQASYKSHFDYANSIQNTNIQRTFVDSMVKNYTNTTNIFGSLVERFGHFSWAQSIVKQYEWYKSELVKYTELQSLLNSTKPTVVSTSYKYNYFPMVTRGTEEQASRTETEVEETFGSVVNVYKDITIVYETKVTTKDYKGILT